MKFLAWLLLASTAIAVEPVKLPLDVGTLRTRDGKLFEGAKITGHDAVGVKIIHAGGVARLEYARLPKKVAARFPRDRKAAEEQLDKEAKQEAAHDRAMTDTSKGSPATSAEGTVQRSASTVEKTPELTGDSEKKLMSLEAYARRLEDGIEASRVAAQEAEAEAKKLENSFSKKVRRTSEGDVNFGPSKAQLHRAEQKREEAKAENQKISQATILLKDTRAQIEVLKLQLTR